MEAQLSVPNESAEDGMTSNADKPQLVVDGDTHFWQPFHLWESYLDPKHRDVVANHIDRAGLDATRLATSGKSGVGTDAKLVQAATAQLEVATKIPADETDGRLKFMDSEGIDACVIYPSHMAYLAYLDDADVASSASRALNKWSAEFAAAAPGRFFPCMVLPWYHPERAVEELRFGQELGLKIAFSTPAPSVERRWSDRALDGVYGAMEAAGTVLAFHEFTHTPEGKTSAVAKPTYADNYSLMYLCAHTLEPLMAITDLIMGGVGDRFPTLNFGVAEAHASWLPGWLDMMDTVCERKMFRTLRESGADPSRGRSIEADALMPSEIFRRQGFLAAFPEDRAIDVLIDRVGPDVLMLSTDYPHINATYGLVEQFEKSYPDLDESAKTAALGGNAARVFGIG
jgi:uncharacterized protein